MISRKIRQYGIMSGIRGAETGEKPSNQKGSASFCKYIDTRERI
jgi:hypothetical protein